MLTKHCLVYKSAKCAAAQHKMRRLAPRGRLSRARQKNGWGCETRARELGQKPRCIYSVAARACAAGPSGDCAR